MVVCFYLLKTCDSHMQVKSWISLFYCKLMIKKRQRKLSSNFSSASCENQLTMVK